MATPNRFAIVSNGNLPTRTIACGLWCATGVKDDDFGKPIIAVVISFTQFVPGHVYLRHLGQLVAREIEAAGGIVKEITEPTPGCH